MSLGAEATRKEPPCSHVTPNSLRDVPVDALPSPRPRAARPQVKYTAGAAGDSRTCRMNPPAAPRDACAATPSHLMRTIKGCPGRGRMLMRPVWPALGTIRAQEL